MNLVRAVKVTAYQADFLFSRSLRSLRVSVFLQREMRTGHNSEIKLLKKRVTFTAPPNPLCQVHEINRVQFPGLLGQVFSHAGRYTFLLLVSTGKGTWQAVVRYGEDFTGIWKSESLYPAICRLCVF